MLSAARSEGAAAGIGPAVLELCGRVVRHELEADLLAAAFALKVAGSSSLDLRDGALARDVDVFARSARDATFRRLSGGTLRRLRLRLRLGASDAHQCHDDES